MSFDWQFTLSELESHDNYILCDILKDLYCNVTEIIDKGGLNLLHHAVLKGIEGKCELLIDFAKNFQKLSDSEIDLWINGKTHAEKWTPLHYASFRGNLDAIYTLIKAGADI